MPKSSLLSVFLSPHKHLIRKKLVYSSQWKKKKQKNPHETGTSYIKCQN